MFACIATKPLNDNTYGCRFNVLGIKGLTRRRKFKSRGIGIDRKGCMTAVHFFKRSWYIEKKSNRTIGRRDPNPRRLRHFAG